MLSGLMEIGLNLMPNSMEACGLATVCWTPHRPLLLPEELTEVGPNPRPISGVGEPVLAEGKFHRTFLLLELAYGGSHPLDAAFRRW